MNQTADDSAAGGVPTDDSVAGRAEPSTGLPHEPAADGPRPSRDDLLDVKRIRRSSTGPVGGVCAGLGRHFDVDPVIFRVLFVITAFVGVGLVAYGACWALIPTEDQGSAVIDLDDSTRSVVLIGGAVLAGLAIISINGSPDFGGLVFLGLIGLGIFILVKRRERRNRRHSPPYGSTYPGPEYAAMQSPHPPAGMPTQESTAPPGDFRTGGITGVSAGPEYQPGDLPVAGTDGPPGYGPPPGGYGAPPAYYRRPPNPRKRGPLLFGFTAALLFFGLGLLGVVDVAGADVPGPAYPALAVAVIGIMLLVGAWFGRAGGLIALGLLATVGLTMSTVADEFDDRGWNGGAETNRPTSASQVRADYDLAVGELVLDLSRVSDPENLGGRVIGIDAGAAGVTIVVPPTGVDTTVVARIDGPGNINVIGEDVTDGVGRNYTWVNDTGANQTLTIEADLQVGEIEVRR
ncbi:MAG: PspC domain-containing protein [Nocardioides sp.]